MEGDFEEAHEDLAAHDEECMREGEALGSKARSLAYTTTRAALT